MKKSFSLILTLIIILSLSISSFAYSPYDDLYIYTPTFNIIHGAPGSYSSTHVMEISNMKYPKYYNKNETIHNISFNARVTERLNGDNACGVAILYYDNQGYVHNLPYVNSGSNFSTGFRNMTVNQGGPGGRSDILLRSVGSSSVHVEVSFNASNLPDDFSDFVLGCFRLTSSGAQPSFYGTWSLDGQDTQISGETLIFPLENNYTPIYQPFNRLLNFSDGSYINLTSYGYTLNNNDYYFNDLSSCVVNCNMGDTLKLNLSLSPEFALGRSIQWYIGEPTGENNPVLNFGYGNSLPITTAGNNTYFAVIDCGDGKSYITPPIYVAVADNYPKNLMVYGNGSYMSFQDVDLSIAATNLKANVSYNWQISFDDGDSWRSIVGDDLVSDNGKDITLRGLKNIDVCMRCIISNYVGGVSYSATSDVIYIRWEDANYYPIIDDYFGDGDYLVSDDVLVGCSCSNLADDYFTYLQYKDRLGAWQSYSPIRHSDTDFDYIIKHNDYNINDLVVRIAVVNQINDVDYITYTPDIHIDYSFYYAGSMSFGEFMNQSGDMSENVFTSFDDYLDSFRNVSDTYIKSNGFAGINQFVKVAENMLPGISFVAIFLLVFDLFMIFIRAFLGHKHNIYVWHEKGD